MHGGQVTLSSLNRHAVASPDSTGLPKATIMDEQLKRIAPWCRVEPRVAMFREQDAEELMRGPQGQLPDFVVDAIDDPDTKVDLLAFCVRNGVKVMSAMGAGQSGLRRG